MKYEPDLDKLKFPIGRFQSPDHYERSMVENWIRDIEELPVLLKQSVERLNPDQVNTSYREGGWTVGQIVHHIGDSHMMSYIRFKLALTENQPTIKPYDQALWAELPDYVLFPIADSLNFVELLHKRWAILLKSLTDEQLHKTFNHPESGSVVLHKNIGIYAWHGKHHLHQIKALIERRGW
jgi:hypothetical protein